MMRTRLLTGLGAWGALLWPGLFPCVATDVALRVVPMFGSERLVLDERPYITATGDTVTVSTFRCYLTQVVLEFADGTHYTEPDSYHLLDAEKEESWLIVLANVPDKRIRSLSLSIGVDSAASVSGALGGDLDPILGMYWAWNSGYINAKIEGNSPRCQSAKHAFEFHIGGFMPPFQTLRRISLPVDTGVASGATLSLEADIATWFVGTDLATTSSVLVPGKAAAVMADAYKRMLRLVPTP